MGNILPLPCHRCCHGEVKELEAGTGAKTRRKQQQRPGTSGRRGRGTRWCRSWTRRRTASAWAWPECRVEPAAGHGEDDGGLRVRIVMKRKDIAQLVATLEQRGAEVVSTELAGCNGNADGWGTMMSPCRDAWRPRLSIIPENY